LKHTLYGLLLTSFVLAGVVAGATSAYADSSTKVFPLAGAKLPKSRQDLADVLTKAVAKVVNGDIASVPIEDAVGWFACDIDTPECLEAVTKQVKARRIVYGTIETRSSGGVAVTLTWYGEDGGQERTFVLTGDSDEELSGSLEHQLEGAMRTKPVPKDKVKDPHSKNPRTGKDGDSGTELPSAPPKPKEPFESGGISGGTWALIGTGAGLAAVGGGFAIWAASLSGDIRSAPTNTVADFDHLQALERAGKLRARIGAGLLVAGGAFAAIGVVRAVIQHKSSPEQPLVDVKPEAGGASVVFTLGLR
jgi:hypothetical protein